VIGWVRGASLRTRLVAGLLALAAVGLLATDLVTMALLSRYLETRTDAQLTALQERVRVMQARRAPRPPPPLARPPLPALGGVVTVETTDGAGRVIIRSPDQAEPLAEPPPLDALRAQGTIGEPFEASVADPGDGEERSFRVLIWDRPDHSGTTMVAMDISAMVETRDRVQLILLVVTLAVLVLIGVLGVCVVRLGLRPLGDVESTAEAIVACGDLSRRVPVRAKPRTEIGRLAVTLNGMLERLEAAFAQRTESEHRLRRFVADASHELRTPTASIRGFAELYRHGAAPDSHQVARLFARIEAEATRMGLLVEDLLMLARLDQRRPPESEPVDLIPLAVDSVAAARAIAPGRPLRLEIIPEREDPRAPAPIVLGDEVALRQVTTNLISNALRHTPADSAILVRVGVPPDRRMALFEVVDHGPGLAPEDAERVFERFYRVDPARSRSLEPTDGTGLGVGLGLSIVAAVVGAHRGTVVHHPTPGGGATFRVLIPLAEVLDS
jgi:two-component system, OmpR family, sensor kinase